MYDQFPANDMRRVIHANLFSFIILDKRGGVSELMMPTRSEYWQKVTLTGTTMHQFIRPINTLQVVRRLYN